VSGDSRLRGVGVGAGYFSAYQYEAWSRIPEVEIVAISNRTESKARAMMERFSIPRYYRDLREMIDSERPDFVDIITPPETHYEYCECAASRGVSVICQKPLAPSFEESRRIVETCRASGVRFMVHENWRWQPWYREVKRIQERGDIGEFTHLYFRMRTGDGWGENAYLDRQPFFREYPRLLVYETGVHFVDTFRYLLGEVETVYARLRRLNPVIRGEDAGQVLFAFRGGAWASWDANRYNETDAPNPRYTFGAMRIDATGGHLELGTDSAITVKPIGGPTRVHEYERRDVNFAGDCCYFLQRHFVDCFLGGCEFESSGEDYLETLRVVDAIYESADSGQPVALEALDRDGGAASSAQ
jgi:predicted dehydrogenase